MQKQNKHISTFDGGLNLDIDKGLLKSNQYRYAENIRLVANDMATTGVITNIEGSTIMQNLTFSTGEVIIATHTVRDFGVIFTYNTNTYNQIYRIEFNLDGTVKNQISVLSNAISLGLTSSSVLSIVGRYEDDDNIKIYWADGTNPIRSINIAISNATITDQSIFDIIPSSNLNTPIINGIGTGRLNSGLIQYAYQLSSPSGSETAISPVTNMIHLSESNITDYSIDYKGTGIGEIYGKPTGKSVKVKVVLPTNNVFTKIKLISIYYYNYSVVPTISIVKELNISSTDTEVYIEDGGATVIGELTQAEFNLLGGNLFVPNYIESKDNRLFASNIQESTWDVENYDTRSYQFAVSPSIVTIEVSSKQSAYVLNMDETTISGELSNMFNIGDQLVALFDINGASVSIVGSASITVIYDIDNRITFDYDFTSYSGGIAVILSTKISSKVVNSNNSPTYVFSTDMSNLTNLDSIHPEIYTTDRYADITYKYNTSGDLGGTGPNVSYLFTNTYFIESYSDYWNTSSRGINKPSAGTNQYIDQRTPRIGDIERTITTIHTRNSAGTESDVSLSTFGLPATHSGYLNYANPYLSSSLRSYQRDEIYRFAAVFYDDKGRKSPAHWIADIRFPAGYYKDPTWDSSIFEMPDETDMDGYASDALLNKQELLVKPLGVSFTFDNLDTIPLVKRIEIVRAKRDINNKTILAQGVVQKTGTYRAERGGNSTNELDIITSGVANTLRPHPIISMGDSYSLTCPTVTETDDIDFDAQYNNSYYIEDLFDPVLGVAASYHTWDVSPFYYNKNTVLFINPETSYYGLDFVSQLKNVSNSPNIDIVDVIYPVSTPPNIDGSTSYYGSNMHGTLAFNSMYTGADITSATARSHDITPSDAGTFITNGLAGSSFNAATTTPTTTAYKNNTVAMNSSLFDIYNPATGWWYESYFRTYISLGGYCDPFLDPIGGWFNTGLSGFYSPWRTPAIISTDANNSNRNALVFKYFCRYFEKNSVDDLGGTNVKLSSYPDNIVTNTTSVTVTSLSDDSSPSRFIKKIDAFEYSGVIAPGVRIQDVPSSEYISIGGRLYLNWTHSLARGDGDYEVQSGANAFARSRSQGVHGGGILLSLDDDNQLPSVAYINQYRKKYNDSIIHNSFLPVDRIISAGLATYVTNMKVMNSSIYGGNSLVDRQFTEYISTGVYIDNTAATITKNVFGGDTFIGLFDYTITHATDNMQTYPGEHTDTLQHQTKYIGALIPIESSINLHVVNSESFIASGNNMAIQEEPGYYSPGASGGGTWGVTQTEKQFDYNAAYSSENTSIGHVSKLINSESNKKFDCRTYSSGIKTNDELYDNWSSFLVSDYIDVDTEHGEITRLYKFNNRLFFFQKNAFGILSVNERSIIKDNNLSELTLGVAGAVLSRFDYIATSNGFKYGIIGGISNSNSNMYWYDVDRAEFCIYGGSIESLSKAKGVQSILNKSKSDIINYGINIPMVYDKKYNELITTIYGIKDASTFV